MQGIHKSTFTYRRQVSQIITGDGAYEEIRGVIQQADPDMVLVVADEMIWNDYAEMVRAPIDLSGVPCEVIPVKAGEHFKSMSGLEGVLERMLPHATRDSMVLAFGGGSVGNTVGLAADLLFRGIHLVHLPTTLMDQADGAIGLKQAVNSRNAKNAFGCFKAPLATINDSRVLTHLPAREFRHGMSECVKTSITHSRKFAEFLHRVLTQYRPEEIPTGTLNEIIVRTSSAKSDLLGRDPQEDNALLFLEIGHATGHAIETATDGAVHHGESIAVGMQIEAAIAKRLDEERDSSAREMIRSMLVDQLGYPDHLPNGVTVDEIVANVKLSNRRHRDGAQFILPVRLGETIVRYGIPDELYREVLADFDRR